MRLRRRTTALLTPLLLSSTTHAISLADWSPKSTNLPTSCNAIYTRPIPNCALSDFTSSCSSACITSLLDLNTDILASCSMADVDGNSLIAQFLQGKGLCLMCPGLLVLTVLPSPAVTAEIRGSSYAQSTPSWTSTTIVSRTVLATSTTTIGSASSTIGSASSTIVATSTEVAPSSSSPGTISENTTTPSSSSQTTSTAVPTISMPSQPTTSGAPRFPGGDEGSGGGSPFDIYALDSGAQHTAAVLAYLVLTAAAFLLNL